MVNSDPDRERRLAAELRANLRRRKADATEGPITPPEVGPGLGADDLERDGVDDASPPPDAHVPGRDDSDRTRNPAPLLPPD